MKLRGEWWFPNEPNKIFYGEYSFDEHIGAQLEILDIPFFNRRDDCDIILGVLEDKRKVTLAKCSLRISYPLANNFQICRFAAVFALLGKHFNNINEIKFESIIVKYSNIDAFISDYALTYDPIKKNDDYKPFRKVKLPKLCELAISPESGKFKSPLVFRIRAYKDRSIEHYIELKSIFLDFLNFVTSSEVFIEYMHGIINVQGSGSTVVILYRSTRPKPFYPDQKVMFKPSVTSLLFHYSKVSKRFTAILSKWFDISKRLKHVYDLYFGVIYSIDQYDIYRFLMLATATEVYHVVTTGRKKPKFVEKIKEVYRMYPSHVTTLLYSKDIDKSAEDIEETRHYYTHYDPNREPNAAKEAKLFWLTKDLQVVLQLCFLRELGFGNERLKKIYHLDKLRKS
jgi:ApeA N-terminal domain 1